MSTFNVTKHILSYSDKACKTRISPTATSRLKCSTLSSYNVIFHTRKHINRCLQVGIIHNVKGENETCPDIILRKAQPPLLSKTDETSGVHVPNVGWTVTWVVFLLCRHRTMFPRRCVYVNLSLKSAHCRRNGWTPLQEVTTEELSAGISK